MQDRTISPFILYPAYPVCVFSDGRAQSSVLGVRSSALIRYRIPGPRYQVPDAWCSYWYQVSGIRAIFILHHASCILHPYLQMHYNCGRVTGPAGPCRSFIGDGGSAGISAPLAVKRGRGGAAPGFKPGSRESVGHG